MAPDFHINTAERESFSSQRTAAETLLHSAAYSFAQLPVLGVTQLADQVAGTDLARKMTFMGAPQEAEFGSLNWHAQQVGSAVGMLPWVVGIHKLVGVNGKEALTLGQQASHSALTGAIYGGIFTPAASTDNFLYDRVKNAAVSATTFGAMSSSAHGLRLAGLHHQPAIGLLSGSMAGLVHAEMSSVLSSGMHASSSELLKDVYAFGTMGAVLGVAGSRSSQRTPPNPSEYANENPLGRQQYLLRSLEWVNDRLQGNSPRLAFTAVVGDSGCKAIPEACRRAPISQVLFGQVNAENNVQSSSDKNERHRPVISKEHSVAGNFEIDVSTFIERSPKQVRNQEGTETNRNPEVIQHKRGEQELRYPDGTRECRFPTADGHEVVTHKPDGTVIETMPDGSYSKKLPNGALEKIEYDAKSERIKYTFRSGDVWKIDDFRDNAVVRYRTANSQYITKRSESELTVAGDGTVLLRGRRIVDHLRSEPFRYEFKGQVSQQSSLERLIVEAAAPIALDPYRAFVGIPRDAFLEPKVRLARESVASKYFVDSQGKTMSQAELAKFMGLTREGVAQLTPTQFEEAGITPIARVNGIMPNNWQYAGRKYYFNDRTLQAKYPDGVQFKKTGYPDFTEHAKKEVMIRMTGDRDYDFDAADRLAGITFAHRVAKRLVWHHCEDVCRGVDGIECRMQLIPTDLHEAVQHTGGCATSGLHYKRSKPGS